MKRLLLLSLLVLSGCSSRDDETVIIEEQEEEVFNCQPENFLELYSGLTLKAVTDDGDEVYLSFDNDATKMMIFTNNFGNLVPTNFTFVQRNKNIDLITGGCSTVSQTSPDLNVWVNQYYYMNYNPSYQKISKVSVKTLNLNEFGVDLIYDNINGHSVEQQLIFREGTERTISPNCPFTLSKVELLSSMKVNDPDGYTHQQIINSNSKPLLFEVINEPMSNFCQ